LVVIFGCGEISVVKLVCLVVWAMRLSSTFLLPSCWLCDAGCMLLAVSTAHQHAMTKLLVCSLPMCLTNSSWSIGYLTLWFVHGCDVI
jgi:hypothetical protein